jgi:hypothetical protein
VAILAEVRSGTNWLGSLTDATGMMGRIEEWLDRGYLGIEPDGYDALEAAAFRKAATPAIRRFAIMSAFRATPCLYRKDGRKIDPEQSTGSQVNGWPQ